MFSFLSSEVFLKFHQTSDQTLHSRRQLVGRCWADLLSESFAIGVLCSKHPHWSVWSLCYSFFSEFHDTKHWYFRILGDGFLWIVPTSERLWILIFLQVYNWEFRTSFRLQGRGMSSVLVRILIRNLKYIFLNFLSLSIRCYWTLTWRWLDLQYPQVQYFDLARMT